MYEIVFEKSWKKTQRKVKRFANDIYKFRKSFAIEPQIEKYLKKQFQKRILSVLKNENISSEQETAICDFVANFSFTTPDYYPHDKIDTYKGYVFIVIGITGFLVCLFALNEAILAFAFLFIFLINGAYNLRRKSAGLAYANQLDSIYHEIKRILAE